MDYISFSDVVTIIMKQVLVDPSVRPSVGQSCGGRGVGMSAGGDGAVMEDFVEKNFFLSHDVIGPRMYGEARPACHSSMTKCVQLKKKRQICYFFVQEKLSHIICAMEKG